MPDDSAIHLNRPPRLQLPHLPLETVDIPAPPKQPPPPSTAWFITIIPVLGIGVLALFYIFRAFDNPTNFLSALPLLFLALFSIGGALFAQRWRRLDYEQRKIETLLDYQRLLDRKHARLQAAYDAQIALLQAQFPAPETTLPLALSRQPPLWERRPGDSDFVTFRVGLGRIPSAIPVTAPNADLDSAELERALTLAETYRFLHHAPVVCSLNEIFSVAFCGPRSQVMKTLRAALCRLATDHAPQDLHIHVIASRDSDWRWLEWLPHTSQSHRGGSADLLAFTPDDHHTLLTNLSQVIDERKQHRDIARTPHLLVILDGPHLAESEAIYQTLLREGGALGASVICVVNSLASVPGDCRAILEINDNGRFRFGQIEGSMADALSLQEAEHIARALASLVVREADGGGRIPRHVDFLDLYNVSRVEELRQRILANWDKPPGQLPYPARIGRESLTTTTEIWLDEEHHGPHGVLAGTTGSGKSELLQTLICSLVIEHPPRLLNLLLIDFKGGSTFNVFADLPHTVGMVTNLDGLLVERALEALKAETQYRQQFLKKMNVRDIAQYHRFYNGSDDPALPHLFIIVDEFAQLAKEMPDFMRELVRTAQVGRSLGLHLLLGTQSPMEVITEEMNANLQMRICLRVQNIEASRAMLRRPDAAYLPAGWPGRGYLQVGERSRQFQTAYVGGDYVRARGDEPQITLELITDNGIVVDLMADSQRAAPISPDEPYTTARAIVETVISCARGLPPMPPLLLPPLEDRMTLAPVLNKIAVGGWHEGEWLPPGRDHFRRPIKLGSAPIGLVDNVYERTQYPLWIHLNANEREVSGHLLVIGGPGSGKTTLLRTLAISEALFHPPDRLNFYFLSFTGGLSDLGSLPHAEKVVHGSETERVRRLFRRLIQTLNARQRGAESQPAIVLFIDQYEQFRDTFYEQHIADFERIVSEGRAAGIYLVITASGMSAIPERLRSLIPQRIALRVGTASDYLLAVGAVRAESALPKGRGFITHSPPVMCQISLPCLDAYADTDTQTLESMRDLVNAMRENHAQNPAPIRELPARIPLDSLLLPSSLSGSESGSESPLSMQWRGDLGVRTPLGRCDDDGLSLFNLDWRESGPHFVITGPPRSGKTNLLHAAVLAAAYQYSPDELRFLLVDFNARSLSALAPLKHVIARVTAPAELDSQLAHLKAELAFIPPLHAMGRGLGAGDASQIGRGSRIALIIDDYDLFAESLPTQTLRDLRDCARQDMRVWAAGYLERPVDPLIKYLLLKRSGFALVAKDSLLNLNVRIANLPNEPMPEGRAYYAQHSAVQVIQTALVENPSLMVSRINTQIWPDSSRARWLSDAAAATPPPPRSPEIDSPPPRDSLDIDTAGLIEDLLGKPPGDQS
jgi:S-DNA-T family DNA segregation ATPase FtsK/SpoIIIE